MIGTEIPMNAMGPQNAVVTAVSMDEITIKYNRYL